MYYNSYIVKKKTYNQQSILLNNNNRRTIRFNRNELKIKRAIFELLLDNRGKISMGQVARRAHISRITVYNHHHNINRAISEIEERLLQEFIAVLDGKDGPLATNTLGDNRRVFFSLMWFMSKRDGFFKPICANPDTHGLLRKMVEALYPRLDILWLPIDRPAPVVDSERVDLFLEMIVCVIRRWGKETGCDLSVCNSYLNRLIHITSTVSRSKI